MWLVEQAIPAQPPQVATEVLMSVSQPLVCRLASQLARPAAQVPLHALPPQVRDTMPVPEQTVPQAPQASGSVVRSRHTLEQLVCPDPQVVTHTPAEQSWPPAQTLPQAPQLLVSLLRLRSQPLPGAPSQLAKPALQLAMVHAPAAQPAVALASEQTVLQAPQLVGLVVVLVSQPSLSRPLQLPKPAPQLMPQSCEVQVAVPLVPTQARPQAPQLETVVVATSQPLPGAPSQSAVPAEQLTLDVVHIELAHTATLPMGGVGQRLLQAPQLLMSPATVLTSQPLESMPSQLAKPATQVPRVQRPATQLAAALASWQVLPHTPQLLTLVPVLTSQPLASTPSQLPKPELQAARAQAPDAQPATPLVRVHARPQAPQWLASFWRSRQTPEQLVVGAAQVEVQTPAEHTVPPPQTRPQMPQLLLSVWSARQVPEHAVCPVGHAQLRPWQEVPPVHARPQTPQLALSVARSRQVPEQLVCAAEQVVVQAPAEQTVPPGQMLPQAPQLVLSDWSARQVPEHAVCPVGHTVVQTPRTHDCPLTQRLLQAPQLAGSSVMSRQTEPQSVSPTWQKARHDATWTPPSTPLVAPRVQRSPAAVAQVAPHAPQFWSVVIEMHRPLQTARSGPEQSTHEPDRQASPALLQTLPAPPSVDGSAQQRCPAAPHGTQVPARQVRLALRQGDRGSPVVVFERGQHATPVVPQEPASGRTISAGLSGENPQLVASARTRPTTPRMFMGRAISRPLWRLHGSARFSA